MNIARLSASALLTLSFGCTTAETPVDSGARADAPGSDAARSDAPGSDAFVGDAGPTVGTSGCGMATTLETDAWVTQTFDVASVTRTYAVYLPTGYDPSRAYPIVYQMHGCSDSATREDNNVPVERESGADAIHVRGRALERCWDTNPTGPDVAFFDALVAHVESRLCASPERRFITGYSGGAFMAHQLACVRGDLFRGVASIAGGQGGGSCEGAVAALLIHDLNDGVVGIGASEAARDAHVSRNHCDDTRAATEPSPCEAYDGCDPGLPVVWCQTSMQDHSRQDDLAAEAFWSFLSALP